MMNIKNDEYKIGDRVKMDSEKIRMHSSVHKYLPDWYDDRTYIVIKLSKNSLGEQTVYIDDYTNEDICSKYLSYDIVEMRKLKLKNLKK